MRLILFACLLFFFSCSSFGQKFSGTLKGFQTQLPNGELYQKYQYSEISLDSESLPDSIYLSRLILSGAQTEILISPKAGFGFSANMELDLGSNWAFETGIGLDHFKFNIQRNAEDPELSVLSIDMVPPPPTVAPLSCDKFVSDLEQIFKGENFRLINLYVPAKIYYSIWDGEIRFFAGGYFSKPIFATKRESILTLETQEIENETVCIFTHNDTPENRINDFRKINYGILAGFEYVILKRLAVNISYERGGAFFFSENDPIPSLEDDFPEIISNSFSFGIKYILNP